MGAWGSGSFDNDDASDWVYELELAVDGELVRRTIRAVVDASGYLEAPEASNSLAAAEVVAAAVGSPAASLPDSVVEWLRAHPVALEATDRSAALASVDRILGSDSELAELWADADDPAWINSVQDLRRRLT